ncbi:MAG: hypothetical protein Q4A66_13075, partial [Eubacteriales bacterium]|nr:hypothetical protein [Eubacteriales bacterium]
MPRERLQFAKGMPPSGMYIAMITAESKLKLNPAAFPVKRSWRIFHNVFHLSIEWRGMVVFSSYAMQIVMSFMML